VKLCPFHAAQKVLSFWDRKCVNVKVAGENMPVCFFAIRGIPNYEFWSFKRSNEPDIGVFKL
jgi:hypothetical protein